MPKSSVKSFFRRLNRRRLFALSFCVPVALATRSVSAESVYWNGGASSLWSIPTNWSGGYIPTTTSDVFNLTYKPINYNSTTDAINSFLSAGFFLLSGGTFSGSQANAASTVQVNNNFVVDGGGLSNFTINPSSSGESVTFTNNGNNFINGVIFNANLSFGVGASTRIYNSNTVNGTIAMSSNPINGLQFNDGNASLTLGASGVLRGYGLLQNYNGGGTLTNNGLVSGDASGQTLYLNQTYTTNNGTIEGKTGGTVSIGGLLTGGGASSHIFAASGTVLLNGGGLTGTTGTTTGSGLTFANNGNNYISDATFGGTLTFGEAGYARVYNANTVNGIIDMSSSLTNGLQFNDGNASLTLGATGVLRGYGLLQNYNGGGTLINNGTVSGNVSGQPLVLNQTYTTNNGIIEARNGGIVVIGGLLTGGGAGSAINTDASSLVEISGGGLTGTTGTTTGSGLTFANNGNNYITNATFGGTLTFVEGGYARVYNSSTVNGTIAMSSSATNGLQFNDGNASITLGSNGTLRGYGLLQNYNGGGTITNNGLVSGDTGGQTLYLNQTYTTNNGTIEGANGGMVSIGGLLTGGGASSHIFGSSGTVQVNGGGLTGTTGTTTGSGLTFANNGNNYISGATFGGTLTFGEGGYARVYNANTVNGAIAMSSSAVNGLQFNDGNANLTLGVGGTLRGYGLLQNYNGGGTLVNNGLISGDVINQTLYLNQTYTTSNGTIEAKNGGIVSIGSRLTGGASSAINAPTGSLVEINGGGFLGTLGSTTGSGLTFSSNGANYLDSATVNGTLTLGEGGYARVYNANTVNGVIAMSSSPANGLQFNDGNASITLSATGSLRGYGLLQNYNGGGVLTNNGTVSGDVNAQTLYLNQTYTVNNGTLEAKNGGAVSVNPVATPTNLGTINAHSDGTILFNSNLKQTAGTTQADGTITLANGGGTLMLDSGTGTPKTAGIVTGNGTLNGNVANVTGTIKPGSATTTGTLTLNGSYTQNATGNALFDFGGYTPGSGFDKLTINGSATLGGNLDLTFVNGFAPVPGDIFDIIDFTSGSGQFSSYSLTNGANAVEILYSPNNVRVRFGETPAPGSLFVLGVGALGIALRLRRKK